MKTTIQLIAAAFVALASTMGQAQNASSQPAALPNSPMTVCQIPSPADKESIAKIEDLDRCVALMTERLAPTVVAVTALRGVYSYRYDLYRSASLHPELLSAVIHEAGPGMSFEGSGVIIDPNGYIVTNFHLVEGALQIWVTMDSGVMYPAVIVGADQHSDLAIIKIPASSLPRARVGIAEELLRNNFVLTLGNPLGDAREGEMRASFGTISALHASLERATVQSGYSYIDLIQTHS